MTSEAIFPGTVFISYAREDREQVEPLVRYLANNGFSIWWDENIEPGTSFRSAIDEMLDEAACVIVVWTANSVQSNFVLSEASRGVDRGNLLPVLMDLNARIPVGFTEFQHVDLTSWNGMDTTKLQPMVAKIRSLVTRGPNSPRYSSNLKTDEWVLDSSRNAVSELQDLTSQFRFVGDLLISDSAPVKDLRSALQEVSKTYRVVNSAVLQFITPAIGGGAIELKPFLEMERGNLKTEIDKGRGHCTRALHTGFAQ